HTPYVWKELVLAVIGEQFEPVIASGDEISGLTVSVRQYDDIVRLWNTCANAKTPNLLNRIKELLPDVDIRNPFYKGTRSQHVKISPFQGAEPRHPPPNTPQHSTRPPVR